MEVRGERECAECGCRWSYYDTGSVSCPDCGSLRSRGVGERAEHTATPADLDLSTHRTAVDEGSLADAADDLKTDLRRYVRRRGFIDGGDLRDLDDTYLAAAELLQVADAYARTRDPDESARLYALSLLGGADDGERPAPEDVPDSLRAARGLACAEAILTYRGEVVDWLDGRTGPGRRTLGRIAERAKRVRALQGDVPPVEVEALVRATREVVAYLRDGDETALATARDRLDRLEEGEGRSGQI
ncbi:MAG: hypothetical protein ABEJ81_08545 [Haloferacaceae archaeon]